MNLKSTDELNHEIKAATDIEDYLVKNRKHMLTGSLSEHLNMLLSQKGINKAEVIPCYSFPDKVELALCYYSNDVVKIKIVH